VAFRSASPPRSRSPASRDAWAGTELDIYKSNLSGLYRVFRQNLAPHNLLISELRALHYIREGSGRPGALARQLDLTPAAATQLIDRLERRNLVQRRPDPLDRRALRIRLTPDGARTYRQLHGELHTLIVDIAAGMSPAGLSALRRGSEELARVLAARGAK
jgi:DNA-binding MarR family transcriptional regulator